MSQQDKAEYLQKEKRVLTAMQQTLSAVVRDVTPKEKSLKSPLSQSTTDDIIMCFGLIASRQREIEVLLNQSNHARPNYVDELNNEQTVSLESVEAALSRIKK